MQDRPDSHELLAALRAYLLDELSPAVPRELRFGIRVAANACAILEREALDGGAAAREEASALAGLLGRAPEPHPSPAAVRALQHEVSQAIRAGRFDDRLDAILPILRETVRRRVDIAHPGWSASYET